MINSASIWVITCVSIIPILRTHSLSGNLFENKLSSLLDKAHHTTSLKPRNLHEEKLASLLTKDHLGHSLAANHGVTVGAPNTPRSTKFPPWHYMHSHSNETFEGETVNYDTWKRPLMNSSELVALFRKTFPREERPRYTKYNFTEIGSIFEQAFIDGELDSGDYDYLRKNIRRNMSGIQITNNPFDYLTTRKRKFKPWKTTEEQYVVDSEYHNDIMGINRTDPPWLSTPYNKIDELMLQQWMLTNNY